MNCAKSVKMIVILGCIVVNLVVSPQPQKPIKNVGIKI